MIVCTEHIEESRLKIAMAMPRQKISPPLPVTCNLLASGCLLHNLTENVNVTSSLLFTHNANLKIWREANGCLSQKSIKLDQVGHLLIFMRKFYQTTTLSTITIEDVQLEQTL